MRDNTLKEQIFGLGFKSFTSSTRRVKKSGNEIKGGRFFKAIQLKADVVIELFWFFLQLISQGDVICAKLVCSAC